MSEFDLFRDNEDKDRYLDILKKYCDKFQCAILSYCLMDTHVHLHLDPQGFDISKFMHGVNLSYARYYNRKYKRRGHVFQNRFESKITATEKYCLAVSAYIHNNPGDVEGYRGREHIYPYSSMGIYLGLREDRRGFMNVDFILGLINEYSREKALERYVEIVRKQKKEALYGNGMEKCLERLKVNEYICHRRIILRGIKPEIIMEEVAQKLGVQTKACVHIKYGRAFEELRSFTAFILRSLGGLSYKEICGEIGDISQSGAAELCRKGYKLLMNGGIYVNIFESFVTHNSAA